MIWIVMCNGKVDEVFDNSSAALHHAKQLNKKWALTDIIPKEVKSL